MEGPLAALDNLKIAVVGDLMLDRYVGGTVQRISPEAPVPVLQVSSDRVVPGGAANVAANLATLGLDVRLVGVIGEDEAGRTLVDALDTHRAINVDGIVTVAGRMTVEKLRVIGAHQQIVRIDREDDTPLDDAARDRCTAAARAAIDSSALLVLSDYGKGVCSSAVLRDLINHAVRSGKPVLVDPKQRDLAVYYGATLLTPNRRELTDATGLPCETDEEAAQAVAAAQRSCPAAILLTRSEKGMSLFPLDGPPLHLPTVAQKVFDVSGAGDTVIAVIAAAMAGKLSLPDQLRLANHAAGIVVSKLGTATVSRAELATAMASPSETGATGAALKWEQAIALRASWAAQKLTVGFTNGCFDLLHPGHIALLEQAAQHCDRLIVGLNTDQSVSRLKGPSRPIQDEAARARVVGALRQVSAVTMFDEDTPLELIAALRPDLLVKGADYAAEDVVGWDLVRAHGGRLLLADLESGKSTSNLVARFQ